MNEFTKRLFEIDEWELAGLYKSLFSTTEGKIVLQDLKNRCYIEAPLPLGQEGERAEGMRCVIIQIERQLNYEPKPEVDDGNVAE